MQADVIVIGAGAAGLYAARQIANSGKLVTVLEARNRVGGRIHTIDDALFEKPLEGGAEFVHGQLPITLRLLHEAALQTVAAGGTIWRNKGGRLKKEEDFIADEEALMKALNSVQKDMSIAEFLATYFSHPKYEDLRQSLTAYVEGYYAGDATKASTLALKEEWEASEEEDQRIIGGYGQLMQYLYKQCMEKGCRFYFDTPVNTIHWQKGNVVVTAADGTTYGGAKVLLTVPVGVLQSSRLPSSILFNPAIDDKLALFQKLGFGGVIKIALQFSEPFWQKDFGLNNMGFLFSEEAIPTWWTQHPQQRALLTGWCAGPAAEKLKHLHDEALFEEALTSLARIFKLEKDAVKQKITAWKVANWPADPFTHGGYSYTTIDGNNAIESILQPLDNTIYFAGEGLYTGAEIGTVEAAFSSANGVTSKMLSQFQ